MEMNMTFDAQPEEDEAMRFKTDISRRKVLLTGVSVAVTSALLGATTPAMASATETPIYASKQDGDMLFYKHAGISNGAAIWPITASKIGNGWDFRQVFASSNGAIYAIKQNGDMLFYKYTGISNGAATWSVTGSKIGNGWDFRQVFARTHGAIYAIKQNGDMLFYKHTGISNGAATWSVTGSKIGNGWD